MTLTAEIEKLGKETKWEFVLYKEDGSHHLVVSRDTAETAVSKGYELVIPPFIKREDLPKVGECSRCGFPTKVSHLHDGLCPLCMEGV